MKKVVAVLLIVATLCLPLCGLANTRDVANKMFNLTDEWINTGKNDFVEDMKDSKISIEVQEKLKTDPVPNPVPPPNNNPKKTNKNDDYRAVDLSLGLEEMFSQATKKY